MACLGNTGSSVPDLAVICTVWTITGVVTRRHRARVVSGHSWSRQVQVEWHTHLSMTEGSLSCGYFPGSAYEPSNGRQAPRDVQGLSSSRNSANIYPARALKFLRGRTLIHRDIKPQVRTCLKLLSVRACSLTRCVESALESRRSRRILARTSIRRPGPQSS